MNNIEVVNSSNLQPTFSFSTEPIGEHYPSLIHLEVNVNNNMFYNVFFNIN